MSKDTSLLGLNRPEYPPSRELFISGLAWSLVSRDGDGAKKLEAIGKDGFAYRELASLSSAAGAKNGGTTTRRAVYRTRPNKGTPQYSAAMKALAKHRNFREEASAETALNILLEEIEAPYSAKSKRAAATPLTLETTLLQDLRGITGKDNPANLPLILEKMYQLGGGTGSVAGHWVAAVKGAGPAGLPTWLTEVLAETIPAEFRPATADLRSENVKPAGLQGVRRPRWLVEAQGTPYQWFVEAWDNLCQNGWIDAMPRRRWTDWAACVARTALATGYMFEMHLYRRLCAALVSRGDAEVVVAEIFDDAHRLFSWDDLLQRSAADVGPTMNQLAGAGTACMQLLADLGTATDKDETLPSFPLPSTFDDRADGLVAWLAAARNATARNDTVKAKVAQALAAPRTGGANNTWEMIRYSLLNRGSDGTSDLYGLLRSAGRYAWVEPGQEWLVTVSSLRAGAPRDISRLTDLQSALKALGIDASQRTLVARLEGYGLARSSHDADDALEIMPGF